MNSITGGRPVQVVEVDTSAICISGVGYAESSAIRPACGECGVGTFSSQETARYLYRRIFVLSCLQGAAKNDPTRKMWLLGNAWKFLRQIW